MIRKSNTLHKEDPSNFCKYCPLTYEKTENLKLKYMSFNNFLVIFR
jgi:hypothetical protein